MSRAKEYQETFPETYNPQVVKDLENLPSFLVKDLKARDEYDEAKQGLLLDCLLGELRASINIAEVEQIIVKETAHYLRWKYFGYPLEGIN